MSTTMIPAGASAPPNVFLFPRGGRNPPGRAGQRRRREALHPENEGRPADGVRPGADPGSLPFGFGEIPIGFASSPTRKNTPDIVIRTVGRVSAAVNRLERGQSLRPGPARKRVRPGPAEGPERPDRGWRHRLCPTRSLIQYILDRRPEFQRFLLSSAPRPPRTSGFWRTWPRGASPRMWNSTKRWTGRTSPGRATWGSSRSSSRR